MVKLSYSCLREEPQRVDVSLMVVIFTCDGLILGGEERIEGSRLPQCRRKAHTGMLWTGVSQRLELSISGSQVPL